MSGSFAVDRDGEDLVHLITARSDTAAATGSNIRYRPLPRGWDFWKPVGGGSDDVFATRWLDTLDRGLLPQVVARANTRSVQITTLTDGQPAGADRWLFDAKGRLAVVTTTVKDRRGLDKNPLVGAKDFDVSRVEFDTRERRVVGAQVLAQRPSWLWFDEGLAQAQAAVDKALPVGRSNRLLCGHCAGAQRFVMHSTSDQHAGE
jgi:hypothetical protein